MNKMLLATMCIVAAVMGAGNAHSADVFRFSLLAETMRPVLSTTGYNNTSAYLTTTSDTPGQYIGQLNLPHGEKVLSVRCYGIDTDPNEQFYFAVFRYKLYAEPVYQLVTNYAYSGDAFAGGKIDFAATVLPNTATIDNENCSYGIFLVLPKAQAGTLGVLRFEVVTTATLRAAVIPMLN